MNGRKKRERPETAAAAAYKPKKKEMDGWNKIRGLKAKVVCFNRKLVVVVVVGEREKREKEKRERDKDSKR